MGKAEVGTPKYIANKMKAKGLQRLRWYCQVCEKQCRDENGFKCHTQSPSHVRNMMKVGENANKSIDNFSKQFLHDFVYLLRTSHGEKAVSANRFYNEYIGNKDHIHMNATKWTSLTELVKYLGREHICKVNEDEKDGLTIAWIDNSAEALQRQETLRKKERLEKDDEYVKQKLLNRQIEKANSASQKATLESEDAHDSDSELKLNGDDRVAISMKINNSPNNIPDQESKLTIGRINPLIRPNNPLAAASKTTYKNANPFKASTTSRNANPFRANVLSSKVTKPSTEKVNKPLSALDRIILKEKSRNGGGHK